MELILTTGVGIVIGMYITTQIKKHVANRNQNKELLKNMREFDKTYNNGNFTYYYTHKKKENDN